MALLVSTCSSHSKKRWPHISNGGPQHRRRSRIGQANHTQSGLAEDLRRESCAPLLAATLLPPATKAFSRFQFTLERAVLTRLDRQTRRRVFSRFKPTRSSERGAQAR
mmetsp:Transcript_22439/g.42050  ORF Transcript_22439/g.42050 Transcript_22439/m.42050 type:complete len:108 (-) Transcript_22439:26-349(-)